MLQTTDETKSPPTRSGACQINSQASEKDKPPTYQVCKVTFSCSWGVASNHYYLWPCIFFVQIFHFLGDIQCQFLHDLIKYRFFLVEVTDVINTCHVLWIKIFKGVLSCVFTWALKKVWSGTKNTPKGENTFPELQQRIFLKLWCHIWLYVQYTRPASDVNMLGEMMFGSVSMSYKGSTLKIHHIRWVFGV